MKKSGKKIHVLLITLFLVFPFTVYSQYFGRNKPGYKDIVFKVIQSPNFEVYHYLENDSLSKDFLYRAEEWYEIHQAIFKDTFNNKNPIILYSNHSDFQQTNTINSLIGTGTGGVTESLKNRVIMPIAPTLAQTDHILGHELVHAFQYHKLLHSDTSRNYSFKNLPLWMVEGMAEYLSIGSYDPHTAMWMRDALIHDDFPTLKQLSNDPNYFPYRYGHAFWAMVGKTWGDSIIMPLFEKTALYGINRAVDSIFGFNTKTLSGMWKSAMETHYGKFIANAKKEVIGKKIITPENAGRINISPSISPDGKYLAFFSEKDVFTLDLYLAETNTGKIIKKLSSVTRNHEIDDFSYIESGGTWSPDSKKFAFVVFSKGKNKLAIIDIDRGKITEEIEINSITSFSNPEWSPDGRYLVFSALVDGISDLYLYNFQTKKTERITRDAYSNIHPSWSSDGKYITYSTEAVNNSVTGKKYHFNISLYDVEKNEIKTLDIFQGADNLNPRFSSDNRSIYFLSTSEGFRNLFRYDLDSGEVYRLTSYATGISGITPYSPAISAARNNDIIVYTHYNNGNYEIILANSNEFNSEWVEKKILNSDPGILPPLHHISANIVDSSLYNRISKKKTIPVDSIKNMPYRPNFKLDYISNSTGAGVSTSRYASSTMAGSVTMLFSDIIGNNQLYSALSLNGEIYDFGGQMAYINRSGKIKWGTSISHIPYRSGYMSITKDSLDINGEFYQVDNLVVNYIRRFEDNISFFGFYPFSQTMRLEAGASLSWYYFRHDRYNNYYNDYGYLLGVKKEKIDPPEGNSYQRLDLAYVTDNSFFGIASPMRGHRSRYQVEKYFGAVNFYTALFDYRNYVFMNPVSLAFRFYYYGRYGKDAESSLINPLYIGYPWLIRGYENISFYNDYNTQGSFNISNLGGSRMIIANAELRLPLSGPERLALLKSKYFWVDGNLFFDSGLAFNQGDSINFNWQPDSFSERNPIFSAGASLRINLFGSLILEPFYAIPFQNGGWQNGMFGINFSPGW